MTARDPELMLINGAIFRSDAARSFSEALAVTDGKICAVGATAEIAPLAGPQTEIIDLDDRLACAGFQDAHVHPFHGGRILLSCNLLDEPGPKEALAAIAQFATDRPNQRWVTGGGWRYDWFDQGCPSAARLDAVVPNRPAYLTVADGHSGWANSHALALAGIDAATPDPRDGRIERLADGTPQGTLHEGAMEFVERMLPAPTAADIDRALLAGQQHLLSYGITAWQDAWVDGPLHDAYVRLAADGRLRGNVRGALWWARDGDDDQLEHMEHQRRESTGRYTAGSVKLMLDGVCENFTAAMLEPYLDETGRTTTNCGITMLDPAGLPEVVSRIMQAGFQPHFHAIGDRAVRTALDTVDAARTATGLTGLRPHIAHIQVVHPDDVARFRQLGVVANAQALWACNEAAVTELTNPFLGPERAEWQYPFASLLAAGASMAMGSDWSVSTPDVMAQIDVAVTRQVPGDRSEAVFLPDERIRLTDALAAFTAGSAYVNHLDDRGSVAPGKVADLVVLDRNPFEPSAIAATQVDLTIIDGDVAFERTTSS